MDEALFRSIPLFGEVIDREVISTFAVERSVSAGTTLIREGEYSYDFAVIAEGEAEVTRGGERLATLGRGEFFGEIGVLEGRQRGATVTASTPMRLVTLSRWDLRRVPEVAVELRRVAAERQRANAVSSADRA
jgi:CRP-like cAMP-binding protein